jgi:hypothetical protein
MRFQITGVKGLGHKPITITINADDEGEARELAACNEIHVESVGPAPVGRGAAAPTAEPVLMPKTMRGHRTRVGEYLAPADPPRRPASRRAIMLWAAGAAILAGAAALGMWAV